MLDDPTSPKRNLEMCLSRNISNFIEASLARPAHFHAWGAAPLSVNFKKSLRRRCDSIGIGKRVTTNFMPLDIPF